MTTIETREVITVHGSGAENFRPRCPQCAGAGMLTLEEAAMLAGVTGLAIYRWVEKNQVHFVGSPRGVLWICPLSIQEIQAHESRPSDRRKLQ